MTDIRAYKSDKSDDLKAISMALDKLHKSTIPNENGKLKFVS